MKTKLLIEQHFHGCFGVDFNKATVEQVLELSKKIFQYGIGGIFPTLVTDTLENTRHAIDVIKAASEIQTKDIHARACQQFNHFFVGCCRPQGRHNFCKTILHVIPLSLILFLPLHFGWGQWI